MNNEEVKQCREELKRVLDSETFRLAAILRNFLEYTTEEVLDGRGKFLTQDAIARVLGKGKNFNRNSNPLIRVHAGRLRAKLLDYYHSEGAGNELQIQFPPSGYAPKFLPKADIDTLSKL